MHIGNVWCLFPRLTFYLQNGMIVETEKEELTIPWSEKMKEKQETPPDPDYVTMLEELEHR